MRPTHPETLGAPLDGDEQPPTVAIIQAEIERAEIELMYAIAQHRKAWWKFRLRAEERDRLVDKPGGLAAIESDPIWKKRSGDVAWWRDEMTAQATALAALEQMREKRIQRNVGPALNPSVRLDIESATRMNVRQRVERWDPSTPPNQDDYEAACAWMKMSRGKPSASEVTLRKIREIIRRYERDNPALYPQEA